MNDGFPLEHLANRATISSVFRSNNVECMFTFEAKSVLFYSFSSPSIFAKNATHAFIKHPSNWPGT